MRAGSGPAAFLLPLSLALTGCHGSILDRWEVFRSGDDQTEQIFEHVQLPSQVPSPRRPPPTAEEREAEYNADYSKQVVRARGAYDRGLTGAGVVVAVLDTGLSATPHAELPRSRITADKYIDGLNAEDPHHPLPRHGTAVVAVLAAERDGAGMHGMAPGVQVRFRRPEGLAVATEPGSVNTVEVLAQNDAAMASHFAWATGFRLVNNSWDFSPGINFRETPDSPLRFTEEALRGALPLSLEVAAQRDREPADRTIFVWAAGNEGRNIQRYPDEPLLTASLPVRIPELRDHWLAVVSVGPAPQVVTSRQIDRDDLRLALSSNHCGEAAEFCLAAPGSFIKVPLPSGYYSHASDSSEQELIKGELYGYQSGTSFAAPMVSGALALMMEAFPDMSNRQLVDRLLATAYSEGQFSDESQYGQGLLDVEAAVNPVGKLSLHLDAAGERRIPLSAAGVSVPVAADSPLLQQRIMAVDELGAPFWLPLSEVLQVVAPAAAAPPAAPSLLPAVRALAPGSWLLEGENSSGPGWTALHNDYRAGSLFVLQGVGAGDLAAALRQPAGAFSVGNLPWLRHLDRVEGGGAGLRIGRSLLTGTLFQGTTPISPDPADSRVAARAASALTVSWQFAAPSGHQFLVVAGQIDEEDTVLGRPLGAGAESLSSWLGAGWVFSPAADWHLGLSASLGQSRVRLPRAKSLLQAVEMEPSSLLTLSLRADALLFASDRLSVDLLRFSGSGTARWRLPTSMQRSRVQFTDYLEPMQGAFADSATLNYDLRLGALALGLLVGRSSGNLPDTWSALSLSLKL